MKQIDQSVIGDAMQTAGALLSKAERTARLKALARTRRETDLAGLFGKNAPLYSHIGDFHGGVYECDDVSPWTKSGGDVDADFMIVGQDWSSYTQLEKPVNRHIVDYGFDPDFPTNRNLDNP